MALVPGSWAGKLLLATSLMIASAPGEAEQKSAPETPRGHAAADSIRALYEDRNLCGAQRVGKVLLADVERRFGVESLETARLLDELARAYAWQCTVTWWGAREAVHYAERAVAIKERVLGPESVELAVSLEILAERLCADAGRPDLTGYEEGDCERGVEMRERALEIRKVTQGEENPQVLFRRAALLAETDTAQARALHERAVAVLEDSLGNDHPEVARQLRELALFLARSERDFAGAELRLDRAIAILEPVAESNSPLLAQTYLTLAFVTSRMGNRRAGELYERAIEMIERTRGPDSPLLLVFLNNLSHDYEYSGRPEESAVPLERALAIERETGARGPRLEALLLWGRANSAYELGDKGEYVRLMEPIRRLYSLVLPPHHPQFSNVLSNYALVQLEMGDYEAAERTINRAMLLMEKQLEYQPNDTGALWPVVAKGRLLYLRGQYEEALPLLGIGVTDLKPYGGYWRADCLAWLAEARHAAGDLSGADSSYAAALEIWDGLDCQSQLVMQALNARGGVKLASGDYEQARQQFQLARARVEEALGPDHPEAARALTGLADARAGLGDSEGALAAALEAENMSSAHLRVIAPALSERQALRYAAVRPRGMDLALTLAARSSTGSESVPVWDALVRSRAQVFDELAARYVGLRVAAAGDTQLVRLHAELRAASGRFAKLLVKGANPMGTGAAVQNYRERLSRAREDRERAERALSEKSMAYRAEFERQRLGLDEVREALAPGDALVAFVRYADGLPGDERHDAYAAFVARGSGKPRIVPLGRATRIDEAVNTWRSAIRLGVRDNVVADAHHTKKAMELRKAVWDPLASYLGGTERVFVVPDGSLNLVSFSALPAEGGRYLLESGPVLHHLVAERDLVGGAATPAQSDGLLAFGGPAYDEPSLFAALADSRTEPVAASAHPADSESELMAMTTSPVNRRSDCDQFLNEQFPPLPATLRESKQVARLWRSEAKSRATRFESAGASEAAFKEHAPTHRVLHIATHGFFLGGECQSALAPTRGTNELVFDDARPPSTTVGENPLLLSGLVLAGANHREHAGPEEEDGILTAEEIASLDLSGVEWAVLSACETGVGEVQAGEGVFGLRRAFEVAGAKTLIMSLWSVEDEATRAWMNALYRARLERGLDTAESVRAASLAVLNARRAKGESTHPFYWGAFVAAGDWR